MYSLYYKQSCQQRDVSSVEETRDVCHVVKRTIRAFIWVRKSPMLRRLDTSSVCSSIILTRQGAKEEDFQRLLKLKTHSLNELPVAEVKPWMCSKVLAAERR